MIETGLMVAVIIGIIELFKQLKVIPDKFLPLVSLALGIIFAIIWSGLPFPDSLLQGLVIGLSACGLYSGTKNVTQGVKEVKTKSK